LIHFDGRLTILDDLFRVRGKVSMKRPLSFLLFMVAIDGKSGEVVSLEERRRKNEA